MVKLLTRAERINDIFSNSVVTVNAFCEKSGITPQAVSKARKTGKMSIENLALLANMSGRDLEWLAVGTTYKARIERIPGAIIDLANQVQSLNKTQRELVEGIIKNFKQTTGVSKHDEKSSIHQPLSRPHEQPPSEQQLIDDGYEPGDYDLETSEKQTKDTAQSKR